MRSDMAVRHERPWAAHQCSANASATCTSPTTPGRSWSAEPAASPLGTAGVVPPRASASAPTTATGSAPSRTCDTISRCGGVRIATKAVPPAPSTVARNGSPHSPASRPDRIPSGRQCSASCRMRYGSTAARNPAAESYRRTSSGSSIVERSYVGCALTRGTRTSVVVMRVVQLALAQLQASPAEHGGSERCRDGDSQDQSDGADQGVHDLGGDLLDVEGAAPAVVAHPQQDQ